MRQTCVGVSSPGSSTADPRVIKANTDAYGDIRDKSAGSFASVIGRSSFLQTAQLPAGT